ncbi:ferritin-like domain-containing protein [Peziza echinospora]|nr:ferritin-like domain-containing protein [Peziza echinospora]
MSALRFFTRALAGLAALTGIVSAVPVRHTKRQASGLSDLDILQFALTLEHLEAAFYRDGFARFPASDFEALGFNVDTIAGLVKVGETEATHVSQLMAAIAGQGVAPVPACTYEFGFTDAATMIATAKILEAVGVSAYLGAAPLITNPGILAAAASIVTVEARHQTLLRTVSGDQPIPQAFDVAISARQIFTLAAQFISSCPPEANLNIQAFPALVITNAGTVSAGSVLRLADQTSTTADGSAFCSFASGAGAPQFVAVSGGSCAVPSGLTGEVFVTLTTDGASGADDKVIAGPAVLVLS